MSSYRYVKGFTVVELLITVSIMGLLLALATPSIKKTVDKQRVTGVCESIYQNLALARSSAASLNKTVTFSFKNNNTATWCLGLTDNSPSTCNCSTGGSTCTVNSISRMASYADFSGSAITVSGLASDITFDKRDLMPSSAATITVTSPFWGCKLRLESMGQVKYYKKGTGVSGIVPVGEVSGL